MQTYVHMNTPPVFTLTEALDEADDTSPAPFCWHFHGDKQATHRETRQQEEVIGKKKKQNRKMEEK